jgi:hypothetical protein
MPGRNLMTLPEATKGRLIMLFHETYAFNAANDVIIINPNAEPLQFKVEKDPIFTPVALNQQLAKDVLAHIISSSNLYKKKV